MWSVRSVAVAAVALGCVISVAFAQEIIHEPTWESIDSRPCPQWFDEAKFGIFVVWGVYSVPAWAPKDQYAEWYWNRTKVENHPIRKFHITTYGKDFTYQDFVPMLKAELFDPDGWAELFARSGARYVVMTAQYHDGFCLWPSPYAWNWNSVDIGPHRDLVGDLTKAVRAKGLKMGYYYSLYEWYHPLYNSDVKRFVTEHLHPQLKHLVETYKPSILWADGDWEQSSETWRTPELLAWLFNESSSQDEIAVNDRWGNDCRGRHGGFYTSEYGGHTPAEMTASRKWEENRGMGSSYGYNRNENIDDYNSAAQLIHLLIDTVSNGGNLLLDVGPTADGRIPVIMQQRLIEIGEWLRVNGEAIYGTSPWREVEDGKLIEHKHRVKVITKKGWKTRDEQVKSVRYTAKEDAVYAIALCWPGRKLVLSAPQPTGDTAVTLVGWDGPLAWQKEGGKLHIEVPPLSVEEVPSHHAYVFKLTGVR